MLPTDVRLGATDLTFMSLPELSGADLDIAGVLTNPANHLSGCEAGLGAVSPLRLGSQYPQRVTRSGLLRYGLRGGLSWHGMLFLELLAR